MTWPLLVVLALAVGLIVLAVGEVIIRVWPREPRQPRRPERTEQCVCGREMPVSQAHLVGEAYAPDGEFSADGGSVVSAAFCVAHCPGGCSQGCNRSFPPRTRRTR